MNLTQIMKDNNVSEMDLAYNCEVDKSTVFLWKSGERTPSLKNANNIWQYFFRHHDIELNMFEVFGLRTTL